MYKLFGYDEERLAKLANWSTDWPATAQTWVAGDAASVSGFVMGDLADSKKGTADAVLLIGHYIISPGSKEHGFMSRTAGHF